MKNRRTFIKNSGAFALSSLMLPSLKAAILMDDQSSGNKINFAGGFDFEISLAEFSFAGELMSGKMTNMEFPAKAKNDFDINVVEYVSGFFNNKHYRPGIPERVKATLRRPGREE